jgi:5-methylcytosine-specific restriction endonuclease McrBC regulatory subunit McrC
VRTELVSVGGTDRVATELAHLATLLLDGLQDVPPVRPRREDLRRRLRLGQLSDQAIKLGLEGLMWVVEERGLGGGRELDGLAWQLPLNALWERYVEAVIREEVAERGGEVLVGRLGQTVFPIQWSTSTARSLGHLTPDIVVKRGGAVRIVDAKYKAHFAELDDAGWWAATEEMKEAHRADLHQVLAYASLYEADEITATLVYPVRHDTWLNLRERRRDRSYAELMHGERRIKLELRGIPFGRMLAA